MTRQRLAQCPNRLRYRTWMQAIRCTQVSTPVSSSTFASPALYRQRHGQRSIIQLIESFRCRRGQLFAERRNRGYTL